MKLSGLTIQRKTILAIAWVMLALPFVVLLAGCSTQPPTPLRDTVFAHIIIVDELPPPSHPNALAKAEYSSNGICTVWIRRDVYPACITHEIMHCFSGNWHEGYETSDHCIVEN